MTEEIFDLCIFHKKSILILLSVGNHKGKTFNLKLSRDNGITNSYVHDVIIYFSKANLIIYSKYGRTNYIMLTEKGKVLYALFQSLKEMELPC
jgi:predicted transcriptional regulator